MTLIFELNTKYGEKMKEKFEVCTLYIYPKTAEAAIKLAKEKNSLEDDYVGQDFEYMKVKTNLKLLSQITTNSKIKPIDIASARMIFRVSTSEAEIDEERVREEMMKNLKTLFKYNTNLDVNDYKYNFDYKFKMLED